jgi:hypothetical protein
MDGITTKMLHNARRSAQRTRAATACENCKVSKSKCSGFMPCSRCAGNDLRCTFTNPKQHVIVSTASTSQTTTPDTLLRSTSDDTYHRQILYERSGSKHIQDTNFLEKSEYATSSMDSCSLPSAEDLNKYQLYMNCRVADAISAAEADHLTIGKKIIPKTSFRPDAVPLYHPYRPLMPQRAPQTISEHDHTQSTNYLPAASDNQPQSITRTRAEQTVRASSAPSSALPPVVHHIDTRRPASTSSNATGDSDGSDSAAARSAGSTRWSVQWEAEHWTLPPRSWIESGEEDAGAGGAGGAKLHRAHPPS